MNFVERLLQVVLALKSDLHTLSMKIAVPRTW